MVVAIIIAVVAVLAILILANLTIPYLSKLMRTWWNFGAKAFSLVPFFGWWSHLIIAKTPNEKISKEQWINRGKKADERSGKWAGDYLEREKQRKAAEEAARKKAEDKIRSLNIDLRDVNISSDGSQVKTSKGDWEPIDGFMRRMS